MIDTDRYGRTVGVITVGNLVLNKHLVEYEYAWVYYQYCKKAFCFQWSKAETEAKKEKRGLWKNAKAMLPWEYRKSKRGVSSISKVKRPVGAGSGCGCSGNRYNCSAFKMHRQAQECFDRCRKVKELDRDGDGRACESLP